MSAFGFETPEEAEQRALAAQAELRASRRHPVDSVAPPPSISQAIRLLDTQLHHPAAQEALKVLTDELRRLREDNSRMKAGSALTRPDEDGVVLGKSKQSKAAALVAFPNSGTARARILDVIRANGGPMTDDQIYGHPATQIPKITTVQARRGDLVKGGWLRVSNKAAASNLGNEMAQYEITDKANRWFEEHPA